MTENHKVQTAVSDVVDRWYLVTLVGTEESCVMTLLHHDKRDARLVSNLQLHTRLTDSTQLMSQHGGKLTLTHSVSVVDDACRLEVSCTVELHQQVTHHSCQLLNYFLPVWL